MVRYGAASLASSPSPAATVTTGAVAPVGVALGVLGNLWVTHQNTAIAVAGFAAAEVAGTESVTPTAKATIGGFSSANHSAFDPPPYNLPLSH